MRIIMKTDSIPKGSKFLNRQIRRASKCRLIVDRVEDTMIGSKPYTTLFLSGSRLGFIKYWGIDLITGNCDLKEIPHVFRLMFK